MTATSQRTPAAPARQGTSRPPGPAGDPLLGSLRELRSDPLNLFANAAARYDEVASFRAAHRRVYLLVGAEAIAHVGIHNRANYVKGVSYEALRVPIGEALLTADGETWRTRRRVLMPVFSRRALLEQLPAVTAAVAGLCERWDRLAESGEPVELASEMNRLAFDVVGRVLMGTSLGPEMEQLEPLIAEASEWVARRTRALVPVPPNVPTPRNREYRRAEAAIRRFAEGLIEARRADGDHSDLVSRLISAGVADGEGLDDVALRDEVIGFLMAGHQTIGAALAWTLYLVARHPGVEARLAAESAPVLRAGPLAPEGVERLGYAGQVLDESMRLYPPGWAFTRTPLADDSVAGYRVPAGSVVVVSSYANQRNPRLWPDPEAFDPDRFAPGRPSPGQYSYFPFGIGPHACIGKHLADIEGRVAVATLGSRYRLELLGSRPVRPEPAITLTPRDPIMARIRRAPATS